MANGKIKTIIIPEFALMDLIKYKKANGIPTAIVVIISFSATDAENKRLKKENSA
jgi:hypothetical protein